MYLGSMCIVYYAVEGLHVLGFHVYCVLGHGGASCTLVPCVLCIGLWRGFMYLGSMCIVY